MTAPDKLEPSEWKWVPKYPDDAMFNAGVVVCRKKTVGSIRRAQAVWDAMYLAAPTPPSPPAPAMGEWREGGKYRKRPIVVDAFRLGHDCQPDWFCDAKSTNAITTHNIDGRWKGGPDYCLIHTLEGQMRGEFGDWIIQGVKGEIYPCKADIFEATYEPIPLPPPPEKL